MIILDLETTGGNSVTVYLSRNANFRLVEQQKALGVTTTIYDGTTPEGITIKGGKTSISMEIYQQLEKLKVEDEMAFGTKG